LIVFGIACPPPLDPAPISYPQTFNGSISCR
jgi:hypothetical protein